MVEAVSVAREGTNGESSSDSVSTQECAKLHLRASIFQKKFLGGACPPRERRLRGKPLRGRWASPTKGTTLKDFLDPPLILLVRRVRGGGGGGGGGGDW